MIEETGRVISVSEDNLVVETVKQSSCSTCSSQKSCGQSVLAKVGDGRKLQISVDNPDRLPVKPDDQVVLGVEESTFLSASLLIYLLPLVAMFVLAVFAQMAAYSEPVVILSALAGLLVGFLAVRLISRRFGRNCRFQPVLLRVVTHT
ncbi:SoxR reducing system RseC family protein [Aliamphritea spongicola]|uniref:SoxR reducing system RseC family protein n=1 Tax=Aliamphritea spongicola TaxID=707589 RepID=UPI00196A2D90|nr:SoxR reducing system RseC family protein [Aliamphritea spongicola]MBN3564585.1 SoxR reducing system RseC family protein [Aliamphritea spongicola]